MIPGIKYFLRPYYVIFITLMKMNWWKTFYLNFKTQPLRVAMKLPIIVYGRLKIYSLDGSITLASPVRLGMVKIGYNIDQVPLSGVTTQLLVSGCLIFHGNAILSSGLSLAADTGSIVIGNNCMIGSGSFIKSLCKITIGDNTRIAYGCTVFDSNMHYVRAMDTNIVKRNKGEIIIGRNCWISSGAVITKGTVVPEYSIVARNAFLNKNYSSSGMNSFIVGSPAKVLTGKVQRIFSTKIESSIKTYFAENPEKDEMILGENYEDHDADNEMFFRALY